MWLSIWINSLKKAYYSATSTAAVSAQTADWHPSSADIPVQPSTSIMKYPEKTDKLPSIPRSLKNAGYNLEYYYGGDADFTNMRSYLVSSGIEKIISDKDFPLSERTGKWGAQDHVLFQRLMKDLKEEKQEEPFLKLVQTSSSHEPFEVRSTGWMIKSSILLRMPIVAWEIS